MAAYLVVENLVRQYDAKVILDIDRLTVDKGEVLAVIGPNGAGKSTLLRLIAHLEKPSGGSIRFIDSEQPRSELDTRRRLACVFQEPLLFTGTVFDNIAFGLKVRHVPKDVMSRRVHEVADMFGITHLLDQPSNLLSGGEAQRTSLARAFVLKPELLLLDEPMASLDPPTRESLLIDLHDVLEKMKTTVIYITHELVEAMVLADRCMFMDEGKIIQVGSPGEVMAYPTNPKIAAFVGVENIFEGMVIERRHGIVKVKVDGSEIEAISRSDSSDKVWVFIRPENVTIALTNSVNSTSARNMFSGVIRKILDLGALYRVVVDCGFLLVVFVAKRSMEEMGLHVDQQVWASFKSTGVHVISGD